MRLTSRISVTKSPAQDAGDPWAEMEPVHPPPRAEPVPGTEAGWLLAVISPSSGRITSWTHATPMSQAEARFEAGPWVRGTGMSVALCRVVVEEVLSDD